MKTYQEYEQHIDTDKEAFILSVISDYKQGDEYRWAVDGDNYINGENTEIMTYRKIIMNVFGEAVEDCISANNKIPADFFGVFVRQRAAYVLGNGIEFKNEQTKEKLGKDFDHLTYFAGQDGLAQAVVYGFWNNDHIEYFTAKEIAPLKDEETGLLRAAIRFWQLADGKPMRVTLFEEDGITEYRTHRATDSTGQNQEILVTIKDKRPYIVEGIKTAADGIEYNSGSNYSTLPIVPWYPTRSKKPYLKKLKPKIDAYDLLMSGMVNDSDMETLYWVLKNQGGMNDNITLQQFVERMRVLRAVVVDEGDEAVPHQVEPPIAAKATTKEELRQDLYRDAMALDTEVLKAGNVTATQINAAYEPLNEAADEFEFCTIQYITSLLKLLDIDDYPKFTRSMERNKVEETNMVLAAGNVLDSETIIDHLPFLTPEEKEEAKKRAAAEEMNRFDNGDVNGLGTQPNGLDVAET